MPVSTRRAIQAGRARLDSVLGRADALGAAALVMDDAELRTTSGVVARGPVALPAYLAALGGRGATGAIVVQPRETELCADGGYDVGTYTRYRVDEKGERTAVFGGYAVRWRMRAGAAAIAMLVTGDERAFVRVPSTVVCVPARLVQQRKARAEIAIAPVYSHWTATASAEQAAALAGWTAVPVRGAAAALTCLDGRKSVSMSRETRVQLSARARVRPHLSAEFVTVPAAVDGCMQAINAGRQTVVSRTISGSDHAALLDLDVGNVRFGAGLAYARIATRASEDSIGSSWVRARTTSRGGALGFAGDAAYRLTLGPHVYTEAAARVRLTPAVATGPLLYYTPQRISTSGFALSFGGGVAF